MTEVFVLKSFICAMDGIGIKKTRFPEGVIASIPDSVVLGLEEAGYISLGDDIPVVAPVEEEIEELEEEDELDEELLTQKPIEEMTKRELIAMLEAAGEELSGKENKSTLLDLATTLFEED
jgi:hypothetical protein